MKRPSNLERPMSSKMFHVVNEALPLLKMQQMEGSHSRPAFGRRQGTPQREELTAKGIQDRYKAYSFDKQFEYLKLDTRILHSLLLGENQAFQDCVFLINQYNEEVEEVKRTKVEFKHGPWKMRFYSNLYNLLKEVILTRDRVVQRLFVKQIHDWANSQLESLESEQQQIKPFEGDPTFMSLLQQAGLSIESMLAAGSSIAAATAAATAGLPPKMSVKRVSSAHVGNRAKSVDKSQVKVSFQQQNFMSDESGIVNNSNSKQVLDESTRDVTRLDETNLASLNETAISEITSHRGSTSFLTAAGSRTQRMKQPSEYIAEALYDYKTAARTDHPEYEPPAIRLKTYKRRVLSFDDPTKFFKKSGTEPAAEVNEFAGVTYPKPFTFEDMKRKKEEEIALALAEEMERQKAENAANGIVIPDAEQPANPEAVPVVAADGSVPAVLPVNEEGGDGEQAEGIEKELSIGGGLGEEKLEVVKAPLQPNIKNFTQDSYGKEMFVRNLNRKFDVRSQYQAYEPTEETPEMRMEQKWLAGRQKEVKEKRENEEMLKITKEFSLAKGRLEKEINRKIDSNIYGSRFKDCEFRHTKRSAEEMVKFDRDTKEVAWKQNALQDLLQVEEKTLRIETKKKEREERRSEREANYLRKKKLKGQYDSDSDKENDNRDNDSYDEELDGPFDATDPKYAKNKKLIAQQAAISALNKRREMKSVDLTSTTAPKIAKSSQNPEKFPFKGVELDARRAKIDMVKRLHGNFIGISANSSKKNEEQESESKSESQNELQLESQSGGMNAYFGGKSKQYEVGLKQRSLSVYSRDVMQKMRPFSAIFEEVDMASIQNEQLAEINEVKNRLTKYQLAVPYKKLKDAILCPEGLVEQEEMTLLPEPGYGLLRNPFMKDKKKKKKKKKKRS